MIDTTKLTEKDRGRTALWQPGPPDHHRLFVTLSAWRIGGQALITFDTGQPAQWVPPSELMFVEKEGAASMKWLRSKSFWGSVIVAGSSIARVLWPESPVPELVLGLGASLGLIGVAHKVEKARRDIRSS